MTTLAKAIHQRFMIPPATLPSRVPGRTRTRPSRHLRSQMVCSRAALVRGTLTYQTAAGPPENIRAGSFFNRCRGFAMGRLRAQTNARVGGRFEHRCEHTHGNATSHSNGAAERAAAALPQLPARAPLSRLAESHVSVVPELRTELLSGIGLLPRRDDHYVCAVGVSAAGLVSFFTGAAGERGPFRECQINRVDPGRRSALLRPGAAFLQPVAGAQFLDPSLDPERTDPERLTFSALA